MRWPSLFEGVDPTLEEWIIDELLLETKIPSIPKYLVAEGLTIDGILERWENMKLVIMETWNEEDKRCFDRFVWKSWMIGLKRT